MRNNLVLGGDGFVGKPLCEYLRQKGENVTSIDVKSGADARQLNLKAHQFDRVYFLAWETGGAKYLYEKDTQLTQLEWNLQLLSNVMPQIKDIPFLFVSSQLASDCNLVYGVLKRLGEVWTNLSERGVSIRMWNVYGPWEDQNIRSHVASDFVCQALLTGEIRMMTTGEEVRQFTHITDVCDAYQIALDSGIKGVYDIPSFQWTSILELAQMIQKETNCRIYSGSIKGHSNIKEPENILPDWAPKISLDQGIHDMVQEYRVRLGVKNV